MVSDMMTEAGSLFMLKATRIKEVISTVTLLQMRSRNTSTNSEYRNTEKILQEDGVT